MLAKKVQLFLNAFHYSLSEIQIVDSHEELLDYLDHAMQGQTSEGIEIAFK